MRRSVMCYPYNREFRRDIKKDATKEPEERPEPRVEAKDYKFWAFPRSRREFTAQESEPDIDRTREKV
jgi:hypothetical protein